MPESLETVPGRLVNAERLLEILFDEESRPSVRWLRKQTARQAVPFIKVGHLVFFDPARVRKAWDHSHTVKARQHR